MKALPWVAVALSLLTGGLFQVGLLVYVMRKDRNHITQTGLGCAGVVPLLGAYVLAEKALQESGHLEVPRTPIGPSPEPTAKPVGSVSEYRRKL